MPARLCGFAFLLIFTASTKTMILSVQFNTFSRVVAAHAGVELQILDKIAFIILFHAATMPREKARWLPAHSHSSMSCIES